jgi:23S rRNA (uridine2552-2'-O)-methyltransferase
MRVVDLGAAPGGWSEVAAEAVGSRPDNLLVVAADLAEMDAIAGVRFLKLDITDPDAPAAVVNALGGRQADIVLSDMAPPATGHRGTDHLRILVLVEAAAQLATEILAPGGTFVAKVLQGGTERQLLGRLKTGFAKVVHAKPPASRSGSAETYLVATGYRT